MKWLRLTRDRLISVNDGRSKYSISLVIPLADRFKVRRHFEPLSLVEHLPAVVVQSLRRILPARRQRTRAQFASHAVLRPPKHQRCQGNNSCTTFTRKTLIYSRHKSD